MNHNDLEQLQEAYALRGIAACHLIRAGNSPTERIAALATG